MTVWQAIKSDLHRYSGKFNFLSFFKYFILNPYFRFQCYLRMCRSKYSVVRIAANILKRNLGKKTNSQISAKVNIGYGLYIPHGNVVINSSSAIGHNFSLMQFSTIGATMNRAAAVIGNNVYVSPNVCIIGSIDIQSDTVIGAGAVVNKSVFSGTVVAGVPAKIISNSIDINSYIENPVDIEAYEKNCTHN